MKLLLDEHYPPSIAARLRELGQDTTAVQEEPGLRGLSDPELFSEAQRRERAVLTENVADFVRLDAEYRARQQPHWGLVLTSNRAFPRGDKATVGALIKSLDELLRKHSDAQPSSFVEWLQRSR